LIGITGTNGKTSIAYLIESIVKASGARCGLISTIEYRGPEGATANDRTTPESLDLQEKLADFVRQGCDFAVMEVSSHALALERVHATRFRTAVFTNLSQDHLDFHGTMQNYFEAKKKLFFGTGGAPPLTSVINHDDPYGAQLEEFCAGPSLSYSTEAVADFQIAEAQFDPRGTQLLVLTPRGQLQVRTPLFGKPNQSNVLAALAVDSIWVLTTSHYSVSKRVLLSQAVSNGSTKGSRFQSSSIMRTPLMRSKKSYRRPVNSSLAAYWFFSDVVEKETAGSDPRWRAWPND
jgi:UDP-N-acetylmuramoyl-L-alanyl-D-glutamate--2,6-diaminopimelate ligase